jgi:phosphate-selective porin OprO and OprP
MVMSDNITPRSKKLLGAGKKAACILMVMGFLASVTMLAANRAWALSAEELLDLMVDEGAITPAKAMKIKEKARKIDRAKKAEEKARRTRELQQIKQEAKAEAKAEAIKEAKAVVKKAVPKPGWKAYWDNGVKVESADGKNKIKIGGRIHYEAASVSSPTRRFVDQVSRDEGSQLTGAGSEFRRARLYIQGIVYQDIFFKLQFDFAGAEIQFKDAYMGLQGVPYVGHIRVGQMKEPFSLEEQTSSNYNPFIERGLPNVFVPSRKPGAMLYNTAVDKRVYWGMGLFFNTTNQLSGNNTNAGDSYQNFQNWDLTARLAGTPYYEEKGKHLVHLGFSYSHQFRNDNTDPATGAPTAFALRYRQRPEAHITTRTVDTAGSTNARSIYNPNGVLPLVGQRALIATSGVDLFNPEFALVWGPLSIQGEYMLSAVTANRNLSTLRNPFLTKDNPTFQGAYAFISYFLTGEHRKYKQSAACFDRVKPKHNFSLRNGGWGAWEVAFRWSYLNLNSSGIYGGVENDYTIGLNWYLTPNVRWMVNYVQAVIDNRQVTPTTQYTPATFDYPENYANGVVNVIETRFQIDF